MQMFRGHTQGTWATKLRQAGWPALQAAMMAEFLVSNDPPPQWNALLNPDASSAEDRFLLKGSGHAYEERVQKLGSDDPADTSPLG